jgi:hypothetical protein
VTGLPINTTPSVTPPRFEGRRSSACRKKKPQQPATGLEARRSCQQTLAKDDALSATVYTITHDPAHAGLPDDVRVITMASSSPPLPAPRVEKQSEPDGADRGA